MLYSQTSMPQIPLAAAEKILKSIEGLRVSQDAKEALIEAFYDRLRKTSHRAAEVAQHAGRKTILDEDAAFSLRLIK